MDFQAIQDRLWELEAQIKARDAVIDSYSTVIETQAATIDRMISQAEGLDQ